MRNRLILIARMLAIPVMVFGQAPRYGTFQPDRGFMAYGSYSLSDTESIDEANGGLNLRIPLAKLPPGRGGFSAGIDLTYNSQIYSLKTEGSANNKPTICGNGSGAGCPSTINVLGMDADKGGWQYSFDYAFNVEYRSVSGMCVTQPAVIQHTFHRVKYSLTLPDGSTHILRLVGSQDYLGDGHYQHHPDGTAICTGGTNLTGPLQFYTTDGSFIQVQKVQNGGWSATFPDGKKVFAPANRAERICDKNDNCVNITNILDVGDGDKPLTEIVDDLGRRVRIKYNTATCGQPPHCSSSYDEVYQSGYGGTTDPAAYPSYFWRVNWTNVNVGTGPQPLLFHCDSPFDPAPNGQPYSCPHTTFVRAVQDVVLPTGGGTLKYSFLYADDAAPAEKRGWGELREMRLPNASADPSNHRPRVEYSWRFRVDGEIRDATKNSENSVVAKTVFRQDETGSPATSVDETWSYTFPQASGTQGSITGPDGGVKTNYFINPGIGPRLLWKTVSPLGSTVERLWAHNEPWIGTAAPQDPKNAYVRAEIRTPSGAASPSATVYSYDKNGNLKSQSEYDYGAVIPRTNGFPTATPTGGTILRKIQYDYYTETQAAEGVLPATYNLTDANAYWREFATVYKGARRRATVYGAGNVAESATEYTYDSFGSTANVLSEAKWDNSAGASLPVTLGGLNTGNAEVTTFTWSQGNLLATTGPDNDITAITYSAPPGCTAYTNLYPSQIVSHAGLGALEEKTEFAFDCATGVLNKRTENSSNSNKAIASTGAYDLYGRLTGMDLTSGENGTPLHQTQMEYSDTQRWVLTKTSVDSPSVLANAAVYRYDGLGEGFQTRGTDDTGGAVTVSSAGGVVTERARRYIPGVGHYEIESSPFRPVPEPGVSQPPRSWTRREYDLDGRLTKTAVFETATAPPWSAISCAPAPVPSATCPVSATSLTYLGSQVTTTDPAGRTRILTKDGLGRLIAVAGSMGSATYAYPVHQMTVTQVDTTNYVPPKTQTRIFTYTSLGRLKSAANPESGTTSYTYRKGGQLATRTDARGVTLTVTYDGAQRVQTKSYSDGVTPTVRYCYDGEGYAGETCTVPEGRGSDGADYPKGHLTGYGSSVGWTNYTRIDGLGRVTKQEQTINGLVGTKTMQYAYGSGGALKEMTYPSGRKLTYSLTNVGRVSGVSGVYLLQPASYMATAKYGPMGMPLSWKLNDDKVTEERLYNGLGQLTQLEAKTAAGSRLLRLQFAYPAVANDGNLKGQTIDTPTRTFRQHYGYDGASRLRMAIEKSSLTADLSAATCASIQSTWPIGEACLRYQFDAFGNPWSAEQNGWTGLAANGPAWYLLPSGVVNNQIKDVQFDAAGNQWHLEVNDTQRVASYDGEGRVYLVKDNGITTAQYVYDGKGRRVKRKVGSAETYYVYGADGAMVAEYPTSLIAQGPEYVVPDHLGSIRMKFNGAATVTMRRDYEPYGDEIARTGEGYGVADALAMRFTGKERDAETSLDYFGARYMSSAQGRFTSPDAPGFDQWTVNPQSWNLYGYVRNNPLRYIDPTGRKCVNLDGGGQGDDGLPGPACSESAGLNTTHGITVGGGDVTPVQVGWEWLSGTGPRQRTFTEEDRFTQMLRQHKHVETVVAAIQTQLGNCQTPTPQSLAAAGTNPNYNLSGVEGVPKYIGDYSTLATGGTTGNLAVTYLGSYGLSFNVGSVNSSAGTASVSFHVTNTSTIASGTRPPVIGYTPAWQNTVGRALNGAFQTGPMSATQQDFFWTQQVSFNGNSCR